MSPMRGGVLAQAVRLVPGLVAACLALGGPALATTASDLCAPGADPCIVDHAISVTDGSIIDLGARALEIARTGSLDVGTGNMTIQAKSLRVIPTGAMLARGGTDGGSITVITTGDIAIERSGSSQARVDLSANVNPGK